MGLSREMGGCEELSFELRTGATNSFWCLGQSQKVILLLFRKEGEYSRLGGWRSSQ